MKAWAQKIHIYLGLYFLVFIWLFSASGLLLNRHWKFAEFYPKRQQTSTERPISAPAAGSDSDRATALMRQLGLTGELEWTVNRPTAERLDFRVHRPGRNVDVKADLARGFATVQEARFNGWGILHALHTFNGVGTNAVRAERDWSLTRLWTWSMDALAVGLIVLVVTSLILACERRDQRLGAGIVFAVGCLASGFFAFGLSGM